MKIAVLGIKGGVGKTTFSRLICEFFSEGFSDAYVSKMANRDVRLWNITRSELGAGRFHDLLTYVDDIFIKSSETFCKKFGETLDDNRLSIYDFGNDVIEMLFEFEKSEAGMLFFASVDYIFLPIKADKESIKSANYILEYFEKYENIKFVIALTEYYDSLDIEFHDFLYATVHQTLNKLTKKGRAKQILIPFSKFIRDSQRDGQTLSKYNETLNESERMKFRQFRDELNDSFASALLGQNQAIINRNVYAYCDNQSEIEKVYLKEMRNDLDRLGSAIESSMPDLQAIKKLSDILVVPEVDDAILSIQKKLKTLSRKTWLIIFGMGIVAPFIVFGALGYFMGYNARETVLKNQIVDEMNMTNKLTNLLFSFDSLEKIQILENGKILRIICDENLSECKNHGANGYGYIELKR